MKKVLYFVLLVILGSCKTDPVDQIDSLLIPAPDSFESNGKLSDIKILTFPNDESFDRYYKGMNAFSYITIASDRSDSPNVKFEESETPSEPGFYELKIGKKTITIKANDEAGKFNALSTLYQLRSIHYDLPIATISSTPRFSYRGMHLDVCRHFFSVDEVKKYIDLLFFYGYNTFHWHLTEDQGWRIEIKQYPKLQEVAAFRDETLIGHYNDIPHRFDGKKYGGYYTQDEVKEIVAYAGNKGIEVIPEIELPGHSLAAITAYPELACEDKEYKVATKWGVFDDIYCPTETTFNFLQNVLDEVIELFPSKYIHIGGDEAPKAAWRKSAFCQDLIEKENLKDEHELQSYFIKRIEKYINGKGKSIIGWDEILEGGLAPNATVMSWRGIEGGIEAANKNHNVIMTPTSHCYFDYYQSNNKGEPLAIGGYTPLSKVYDFEPIPEELPESKHKFILGAQGNVWTEYMKDFAKVEYMALTRMAALAEVLWKKPEDKNFERFTTSHSKHIDYWKRKGANIADMRLDISPKVLTKFGEGAYVDFGDIPEGAQLQFVSPSQKLWSEDVKTPFALTEKGYYSFRAKSEEEEGRSVPIVFEPHLGNKASLLIKNPPATQYAGVGASSLNNGVVGSNEKYGGNEWLGFQGVDFEAEFIFPEVEDINSMNLRFFKGNGQWIYLPKEIEILTSNNGKSFKSLKTVSNIKSRSKVATLKMNFRNLKTKYLKVVAKNYGRIPQGLQGEGNQAWLFVDEIVIN